jgi:predicted GNAT family acetyltransferase
MINILAWVDENCRFAIETNENLSSILHPMGKAPGIGPEKERIKAPDDGFGIQVLKSPHGSYRYVYLNQGVPVAAVQVVSRDGKNCQIANVYTHPDYRRQGLATLLLRRIEWDFKTVKHSEHLSDAGKAWKDSL